MTTAIVEVSFQCGHAESRDLSDKAAGERAGYSAWLAKQKCTECWKKTQDRKVSKEVAAERLARQQEALDDQERSQLPVLNGSQKQSDWAARVRYELLSDAYVSLVESGELDEEKFESEVIAPARKITSARWWIDNREQGEQILTILGDPGNIDGEDINENPY